ncbi:helix-turn-helix domain-containing protein [Auraticoccus monumenti]|nr:helix-turn-helix transcriptional regulator [Auraticoccus monumenti]
MGDLVPLDRHLDQHDTVRRDRAGRRPLDRGSEGGRARRPGPSRPVVEPLWREVTGRRLRDRRHALGETLAETSARAGVSTQYLSELERGLKDPSSEILAAVAGAVGLTLLDLTTGVVNDLASDRRVSGSPLRGPVALAA